jgi:hypothetical protein
MQQRGVGYVARRRVDRAQFLSKVRGARGASLTNVFAATLHLMWLKSKHFWNGASPDLVDGGVRFINDGVWWWGFVFCFVFFLCASWVVHLFLYPSGTLLVINSKYINETSLASGSSTSAKWFFCTCTVSKLAHPFVTPIRLLASFSLLHSHSVFR